MARPKRFTLTDLNRIFGARVASFTVQPGTDYVTGATMFPPGPEAAPVQLQEVPAQAEEAPDAVDLAFNPPKGMLLPVAEPEAN